MWLAKKWERVNCRWKRSSKVNWVKLEAFGAIKRFGGSKDSVFEVENEFWVLNRRFRELVHESYNFNGFRQRKWGIGSKLEVLSHLSRIRRNVQLLQRKTTSRSRNCW